MGIKKELKDNDKYHYHADGCPWIWVITGCIGSGKTELLLGLAAQDKQCGAKSQYFIKPDIDTRHVDCIESRNGDKVFANSFPINLTVDEYLEYVETFKKYNIDLVVIDEAQFFGEWIVGFVKELYEAGINVYIAGLDKDAFGNPFGFMGELMCIATEVSKQDGDCPMCDTPGTATISVKRNDNPDIISIGGDEKYTVRCWKHRKEI